MKKENLDEISDPIMRGFRQRVVERGNEPKVLIAMLEGFTEKPFTLNWIKSPELARESLKKINIPVMTVTGSDDAKPWSWDKTLIAQLVPGACHFQIQGKDHLTVVTDPKFKMVVKAFLDYVNKSF